MRIIALAFLFVFLTFALSHSPAPSGEAVLPEGELEPLPPVPKLPPHAVAIARLRLRESTLRVDPMSDFNLIRNVSERTGWQHLYPNRVIVSLDNDEIFRFPIVIFVSEHQPMNLTAAERDRLRRYLLGGGFLFVSECSAKLRLRPELRPEIQGILPEAKLKPIPLNHPLYRVPYRIDKIVPARRGGKTFHEGIELDGRLVLVYSQNAEECSWQSWRWTGPMCACLPPEFEYAFRFGVNLVYYALTH
ncbi:MAG: DUF4159 domain-containing protein [Armatimonadetes bacterium]|nr:DUF4159 domain-containing protein [Armatimonadota bacterium]